MSGEKKLTAREAAFASLEACRRDGKYPNLEVTAAVDRAGLQGADKALYTALVYGVTERLITLDYIIGKYAAAKVDHSARCALRLGLYQLKYMDRIPDHAAVGETVGLVKKPLRGFVNAVLRSFIRDGKAVPPLDGTATEEQRMSIEYSVNPGIARLLIDSFGVSEAREMLAASFEKEKLCLRINTARLSAETAAKLLSGSGEAVVAGRIPGTVKTEFSPAVREGLERGDWIVQDEASALAVYALAPRPGDTVIDVCAAPGGKTLSAAAAMEGQGRVYAFDLHESKLSLIASGAKRLGFEGIITAQRRDGRNPDEALFGKADKVLCDVPCSGLGVIGKKPDIKYKSVSDFSRLPEIQYDILSASAGYVKSGGVLVYSTCTVNPAENGDVIRRFLGEHGEFEPYPFESPFGRHDGGSVQLMPHIHGTDGFFVAKFRRI